MLYSKYNGPLCSRLNHARGALSSLLIQLAARSSVCKSFLAPYSAHDAGSHQPGEYHSECLGSGCFKTKGRYYSPMNVLTAPVLRLQGRPEVSSKLHQVIHELRYEGAEVEEGGYNSVNESSLKKPTAQISRGPFNCP
jgi:hypothetical protein